MTASLRGVENEIPQRDDFEGPRAYHERFLLKNHVRAPRPDSYNGWRYREIKAIDSDCGHASRRISIIDEHSSVSRSASVEIFGQAKTTWTRIISTRTLILAPITTQ